MIAYYIGNGSSGWQSPEQLLNGRQTRAVDLFSIGCVLFFCMTKGRHPFGNKFERDSNIINNRVDLFLVEDIPEAVHLFANLLNPDPELRWVYILSYYLVTVLEHFYPTSLSLIYLQFALIHSQTDSIPSFATPSVLGL